MFKVIRVEESLFEENKKIAQEVKEILNKKRIFSFNIMGAPGSGKTSFIEKTIEILKEKYNFAVIEGDYEGKTDSERLEKFKIPIVQINSGSCHLDANMVKKGVLNLQLEGIDILFVENVGNLICPAELEIGTEKNIVIFSITEGDDKIEKYPLIFKVSDICILNKIDLLPYIEFDIKKFQENLKKLSPSIHFIKLSSKTGENYNEWIEYLIKLKEAKKQ